jgi:alkaline phosphatase D
VRLLADVAVRPGDGGFAAVDVDGLLPGAELQYGFFRIDVSGSIVARSPLARFRTPPEDDAEPVLTVAVQSCNGGATRRVDAIGRVADHPEIDVILHVGDMAYNDGSTTLAEYRRSWSGWTTSEGFRAGLASAGLYATWDDHEIDNNWNPEEVSSVQLDAARRSWGEAVAVVLGPDGRVWQSHRWGRTAEILVLDCRSERRPSTRGSTDTYLSRAQMDWLKTRLKDSPCRFKIVMNSVPITNMPSVWDLAADDRWEGYPKQRREVLDWIDEHDIADVWFVSGDFHVGFVGRIQSNRPGRSGRMWEVAVTSGNVNPLGAVLQAPQFRYGSSEPRLVTMTFDPATGDVTARFFNPGNNRLEREIVLNQGP